MENRFMPLPSRSCLFLLVVFLFFPTAGQADIAIALAGDPAPDTSGGAYTFFGTPSINDLREVAMPGFLSGGSAPSGIFVESETAGRRVALAGDVAPGTGGGTYTFFVGTPALINNAGDVVFTSNLSGGTTPRGIFIESGGSISAFALVGDTAPGTGGGVYASLSGISLNNAGEVAFVAAVSGGNVSAGVFRDSLSGAAVAVALQGDAAPGIVGGFFDAFIGSRISDSGDISFQADVDPPVGGTEAYYIFGDGGSTLIAADGDSAPGTSGGTYDFFNVGPPSTNEAGDAVFLMPIAGGIGGDGIFARVGGQAVAIALEDEVAPDTAGGTFAGFDSLPAIGDAGGIAFIADVAGGTGTAAVFLDDGEDLEGVSVVGESAPGTGAGTYSNFALAPDINAMNDVVFAAFVTGGTSAGGIFVEVPEPGFTASLLIGLVCLGLRVRR